MVLIDVSSIIEQQIKLLGDNQQLITQEHMTNVPHWLIVLMCPRDASNTVVQLQLAGWYFYEAASERPNSTILHPNGSESLQFTQHVVHLPDSSKLAAIYVMLFWTDGDDSK